MPVLPRGIPSCPFNVLAHTTFSKQHSYLVIKGLHKPYTGTLGAFDHLLVQTVHVWSTFSVIAMNWRGLHQPHFHPAQQKQTLVSSCHNAHSAKNDIDNSTDWDSVSVTVNSAHRLGPYQSVV